MIDARSCSGIWPYSTSSLYCTCSSAVCHHHLLRLGFHCRRALLRVLHPARWLHGAQGLHQPQLHILHRRVHRGHSAQSAGNKSASKTKSSRLIMYVLSMEKARGYLPLHVHSSGLVKVHHINWFGFRILRRMLSPAQACSRPPSSLFTPCMSPGQLWPTTPVSPKKLSRNAAALDSECEPRIVNPFRYAIDVYLIFCFSHPQTDSVTPVCWVWSNQAVQLPHQDLLLLPPPQVSSGGMLRASWDWSSSCSALFTPGIFWFHLIPRRLRKPS